MTLSTLSFQEGANSLPAQPGRALGGKLRQAPKDGSSVAGTGPEWRHGPAVESMEGGGRRIRASGSFRPAWAPWDQASQTGGGRKGVGRDRSEAILESGSWAHGQEAGLVSPAPGQLLLED